MEMATIPTPRPHVSRLDRLTAQRTDIQSALNALNARLADLQRQARDTGDTPALRAAIGRALADRNAAQDRLGLTETDIKSAQDAQAAKAVQADREALMERCADLRMADQTLSEKKRCVSDAIYYLWHTLTEAQDAAQEVARIGLVVRNAANVVAIHDGLDPMDVGDARMQAITDVLVREKLTYEATMPPVMPQIPALAWPRDDRQAALTDLRAALARWE